GGLRIGKVRGSGWEAPTWPPSAKSVARVRCHLPARSAAGAESQGERVEVVAVDEAVVVDVGGGVAEEKHDEECVGVVAVDERVAVEVGETDGERHAVSGDGGACVGDHAVVAVGGGGGVGEGDVGDGESG